MIDGHSFNGAGGSDGNDNWVLAYLHTGCVSGRVPNENTVYIGTTPRINNDPTPSWNYQDVGPVQTSTIYLQSTYGSPCVALHVRDTDSRRRRGSNGSAVAEPDEPYLDRGQRGADSSPTTTPATATATAADATTTHQGANSSAADEARDRARRYQRLFVTFSFLPTSTCDQISPASTCTWYTSSWGSQTDWSNTRTHTHSNGVIRVKYKTWMSGCGAGYGQTENKGCNRCLVSEPTHPPF